MSRTARFFYSTLILCSLLIFNSAFARVDNPSLYSFTNSQGRISYILGTMHSEIAVSEFPVNLSNLIERSRVVLSEVSLTPEEIEIYPNDPVSVIVNHSPFTEANLDEYTKAQLVKMGIPQYFADRLGDSDCGVLSLLMELRSSVLPLDFEIIKIALENEKPVIALDTKEMRIEARRADNEVNGVCSLKNIFDNYTADQIAQFIDSSAQSSAREYRTGAPIPSEITDIPLAVFRNHAWLPKIVEEIGAGDSFIAVGQAHLYGQEGLLKLLEEKEIAFKKVRY